MTIIDHIIYTYYIKYYILYIIYYLLFIIYIYIILYTIWTFPEMEVPPNHPSHWTILVLKPVVLWIPLHILLHIYLVGGLEHEFYCCIQLGMSSSQLTNSIIFQRG